MSDNTKFVVFYSWQSDSPAETNCRLIREALQSACNRLEQAHAAEGLHVILDEATRDMPGSPNIPQTILEKIRAADAFVGDITTINSERPAGQRACPNPNVMVELGYAIARLGWGRIVLLFNKAHGSFPGDAPFDIDRHRLSDYTFTVQPNNSNESKKSRKARAEELKRPLFDLLCEALEAIWSHRPPKPTEADELAPAVRQRQRDIETLRPLIGSIHVPTMDRFLEDVQVGKIPDEIFYFWEGFNAVASSSLSHIYDPKLAMIVSKFHDSWGLSLSFGAYFNPSPSGKYYSFIAPGDLFTSPKQEKAWSDLQKAARELRDAFGELVKDVHERYSEIDVKQTSKDAWLNYIEFQKSMRTSEPPKSSS